MPSDVITEDHPRHPAPHRDRVSFLALLFGVFGGFAAWSLQAIAKYAVIGYACFPGSLPLPSPAFDSAWWIALGATLVGIVLTAAAGYVAYRSWRATREERGDLVPGRPHELIEIGEGRTRFIAVSGIIVSFGLMIVTIFEGIALFLVPLCAL